jgi:hypothetical protein
LQQVFERRGTALARIRNPVAFERRTQQIETTQAGAKNSHEIRVQIGTRHVPSGWYWTEHEKVEPEDVIERWFLRDGDGRLVARIVQDGDGWWVAHPPITPEPPVKPLDAAVRRAETVALWALPLDRATAKNMRAANRAVWRDRPPDNPDRDESAGVQSKWKPSPTLRDFSDFPDVPDFLKRATLIEAEAA